MVLLAIWICISSSIGLTKEVPITLLEGISPGDSSSSERFQRTLEAALAEAQKLVAVRATSCGFQLNIKTRFYSASDALEAYESGQIENRTGTWFMIGPRRTHDALLVAKGAQDIPSVSMMGSGNALFSLDPLHSSIYSSNQKMGAAAARIVKEMVSAGHKSTYFTVLSSDCLNCREFSEIFDREAVGIDFKKLGQAPILGEDADPNPAAQQAVASQAHFIFLPNYSRISASLMGAIHKLKSDVIFFGGDGWGDQQFGFISKNTMTAGVNGFSVRGFPPFQIGIRTLRLGKDYAKCPAGSMSTPESGPSLGIFGIIDKLTDFLCAERPVDQLSFRVKFEKFGSKYFTAPWGVSAYQLKDGHIEYWKAIPSP